jgi:hypothetical protein
MCGGSRYRNESTHFNMDTVHKRRTFKQFYCPEGVWRNPRQMAEKPYVIGIGDVSGFGDTVSAATNPCIRRWYGMQTLRPFLLFIGLVLAGLAFTAVFGNIMDARLVDQEARRGQAHQQNDN